MATAYPTIAKHGHSGIKAIRDAIYVRSQYAQGRLFALAELADLYQWGDPADWDEKFVMAHVPAGDLRDKILKALNVVAVLDAEDSAVIDEFMRMGEAAKGDATEEDAYLLNLLAVIHRDGGHFTGEHGLGVSVDRAMEKVVDWLALEDQMKEGAGHADG